MLVILLLLPDPTQAVPSPNASADGAFFTNHGFCAINIEPVKIFRVLEIIHVVHRVLIFPKAFHNVFYRREGY
jgi:hypothetical protein